jgi:BirA family biotin operon repressor/biotin-[acetyl-CoA-carboxylase] ligase
MLQRMEIKIMSKQKILDILKSSGSGYVSGEQINDMLGISRAAVWKSVKLLRQEGYIISSKTNRGYKLKALPDILDAVKIKAMMKNTSAEIRYMESVDSTNNAMKKLALEGLEDNTVIIANHQSAGRGRYGREFISTRGKGIYMSILLKPERVEDIAGLTCMTAVAVCRAVEEYSKKEPKIKWTNDVLLGGRKICGILTELSAEGESGEIRYVIVGIGINVNHEQADFPAELRSTAGSLYMAQGQPVDRNRLAAELIDNVLYMYENIRQKRSEYMQEYRKRCVTLGKTVEFSRDNKPIKGLAESIEDDGTLTVLLKSGQRLAVKFGEVSIINA